MSIKYYANKVLETSITGGSGNLVLAGAPLGSRTFLNAIGANKRFTYYIYRQDTNLVWEIGVGYVSSSGGVNVLVRESIVSSSSNGSVVSLPTFGTSFIEPIISESRVNNGFTNVVPTGSSFTADYVSATYIIDASSSNILVTLPEVTSSKDSIVLGFVLNKTIGDQYKQTDAILIDGHSTQLIDGNSSTSISIINDYLQLISIPSTSGWIKLDPIQDATNPYGSEGNIQFKSESAFSGSNNLTWNTSNLSLLVGSSGVSTADIVLSASGTSIINQKNNSVDFRVGGLNNSNLLFTDGSSNTIGINTNTTDNALTINASGTAGVTIYKSGLGPSLHLHNTTPNGAMTSDIIGSVIFSGLNSNNIGLKYASVYAKTVSETAGNEFSSTHIGIIKDGAFEDAAVFGPNGPVIGFNNTNNDGTIIGEASSNEGANILVGYYNNVCGENCVIIGSDNVISTGTFGGLIGTDHAASGYNVWILGGSGIAATGQNILILGIDANNYISIPNSGNIKYSTFSASGTNFIYHNNKALSAGGVDEVVSFTFKNASDVTKTGLQIISTIDNVSNGNESATFKAKVVNQGVMKEIIRIGTDSAMFGQNTAVNGINIVYGYDNDVRSTGNIIYGRDIVVTGIQNVIFGDNISCSGSGTVIFGIDNITSEFGDQNVIIIGSGNSAGEAKIVAIGIDNANSGLYSLSCGYLNGVHGDYSVGVGNSNTILADSSVAVGKNNTLTNRAADSAMYAMGIGNVINISGTGVAVGFENQLRGTTGYVLGNRIVSTGLNNFVIGSDVSITGNNNIVLSTDPAASFSGNNHIKLHTSTNEFINVADTGIYIKSTGTFTIDADLNIPGTVTAEKFIATSGYGLEIQGSGIIESGLYIYEDLRASGISAYGQGITFREDVIFNSGVVFSSNEDVIVSGLLIANNLINVYGPALGISTFDCDVDITGAFRTSEHILCLSYMAVLGDVGIGGGLIIGDGAGSPPNQEQTMSLTGVYVYGSGYFRDGIYSTGVYVTNIIEIDGVVGQTGLALKQGILYSPTIITEEISFTGNGLPEMNDSSYKNVYQQYDGTNYTLVTSDLLKTYDATSNSVTLSSLDPEIIAITGSASSTIGLTLPSASNSLKTHTIINKSNFSASSISPSITIPSSGTTTITDMGSWVVYNAGSISTGSSSIDTVKFYDVSTGSVQFQADDPSTIVFTGANGNNIVSLSFPSMGSQYRSYTLLNRRTDGSSRDINFTANSILITIAGDESVSVVHVGSENWLVYNTGTIIN